ncbi:alpha/beta hydrolase [Aestuariimicrobium sp. p3-SID1156]|uniref:alpha/beta hydrolase n=1 Tax=Aestuariimicrobium sp. p3-SID1156 TaxID=2916038 RepID=UPI00223A6A09|nr:alpha/beta hydrolase [Aestuariimicrobium sp. p3-SID1156]MCT1458727.1 alpha/beta hydrolase [Aestuariimicrobium sp. p3-SID1156]
MSETDSPLDPVPPADPPAVDVPTTGAWSADPVLDGYELLCIDLPDAERADGEPEDVPITASLVRRNASRHRRAVIYVHGWSDYFFQTWMADFFDAQGFDFYALELRRYGRGLRKGLLGGYITDLSEYFDELDRALQLVSEGHDAVTLMAHSTGGLVASLWANERPGAIDGLILNSPWLDFSGSPVMRVATEALTVPMATRAATRTLPLPESGHYLRSIHSSLDGEWDFNLDLKRNPSFTIRPGWMAAILAGHKKVRQGLSIEAPVLSMMSAKSFFGRTWGPEHQISDTVLDVEVLSKRSVMLGPNVTVLRFTDGLHDLMLSSEPVRQKVFASIERWLSAWTGQDAPSDLATQHDDDTRKV